MIINACIVAWKGGKRKNSKFALRPLRSAPRPGSFWARTASIHAQYNRDNRARGTQGVSGGSLWAAVSLGRARSAFDRAIAETANDRMNDGLNRFE